MICIPVEPFPDANVSMRVLSGKASSLSISTTVGVRAVCRDDSLLVGVESLLKSSLRVAQRTTGGRRHTSSWLRSEAFFFAIGKDQRLVRC